MRDRLITLASAIVTLVLVVVLLIPAAPPQTPPSMPTSVDRGKHGLAGLKQWLDRSQVANYSLQYYYDRLLADPQLAPRGNLLISSAPATVPAREQELYALLNWVAQGNSMLLLDALSDEPAWATNAGDETDILERIGFAFEYPDDDAEEKDTDASDAATEDEVSLSAQLRDIGAQLAQHQPQTVELTPALPFAADVHRVSAREIPALVAEINLEGVDTQRSLLVLLRDDRQQPALWLARVGAGQLWVSRYADLFGNITLGEKDNAALLAAIVGRSLQPQGRVIFDDMHFGLSALYDPHAFFTDPRLHRTLGFILAFWLLYVAGRGHRFAPLTVAPPVHRHLDFTLAVGGYFARTISPQAAAQALFRHFFNDLRAHYKLPRNGEPLWELLQSHPRVDGRSLLRVQRRYADLTRKKRYNLPELHHQLLTLRNRIIV